MERKLQLGEYYRHFKNHWYKVIDIAEHTETGEMLVIYRPQYGEKRTYARPINMFLEEVPLEKENPTGQKYRFMNLQELNLKFSDIHYK